MTRQEQLSASFTPIAHQYDRSRNMPTSILNSAIRWLLDQGVLQPNSRIVDVGCGTGQLTLPFADQGFHMTGVDLSDAMVDIGRTKVNSVQDVTFCVGNAQSLEFEDGTFDHAIASKLFQHVAAWQGAADEMIRVVRSGGTFLYFNDRGSFVNQVRRQFAQEADKRGYRNRYRGIIDRDKLHRYFRDQGCLVTVCSPSDWQWEKSVTYKTRQALQEFQERLYAEFWDIPVEAYQHMTEEVEAWIHTARWSRYCRGDAAVSRC